MKSVLTSLNIRRQSEIKRWGIAPTVKSQSIADHQYYVLLYCMALELYLDHPLDAKEKITLIQHAALHDFPEVWMTDIPGPSKRQITDPAKLKKFEVDFLKANGVTLPPLTKQCKKILKLANLIDETWYLTMEMAKGNKLLNNAYYSSLDRMHRACYNLFGHCSVSESIMTVQTNISHDGGVDFPSNSDDLQ